MPVLFALTLLAFVGAGGAQARIATHQGLLCTVCHDQHGGSGNLHLIHEVIETPNSGPRPVVFAQYTGPGSFADGDAVYDGVCEVCHTTTLYHRNDASGDHGHFAATDCRSCHSHDDGFSPSPPTSVAGASGGLTSAVRGYPVPTEAGVTIVLQLPSGDADGAAVATTVFDVGGRRVRTLPEGSAKNGRWEGTWDGRDESGRRVDPGLYFARVRIGPEVHTAKLVVLR